MNVPRMIVGLVLNLLGLYVAYKGVKTTRARGIGEGFLDFVIGIGFVLLGLIIWTGYIN